MAVCLYEETLQGDPARDSLDRHLPSQCPKCVQVELCRGNFALLHACVHSTVRMEVSPMGHVMPCRNTFLYMQDCEVSGAVKSHPLRQSSSPRSLHSGDSQKSFATQVCPALHFE